MSHKEEEEEEECIKWEGKKCQTVAWISTTCTYPTFMTKDTHYVFLTSQYHWPGSSVHSPRLLFWGRRTKKAAPASAKNMLQNPRCAVTDCGRPSKRPNSPGSTWSWGRGRWAPRRRAGPAAPSCGSGPSNSSPWTGRRLLGSSSPLVRRSTLAPRRCSSRRSAGGVRPGGAHSAHVSYKEILDKSVEPEIFWVGLNHASRIYTFVLKHDWMLTKVNQNLNHQQ